MRALESHPDLDTGLPVHFLQSMEPKLDAESLAPVSWPPDPSLEWCPPGHGDVYSSLRSSGMLDALLEHGFRYAMISNADNLGLRRPTPGSRRHLERGEIPFLMEVVEGTEADRKGGHIARRRADGQLVLRETAQTPPEDEESFRDYRRWRYYNTNSLWVDLHVLKEKLDETGGVLELPLIINRKTVDPRDPSSPPVIQLESAMGAAIGSFKGAQLLCVPRARFVPVKTTDDLLVLRSDVYTLSDELVVSAVPERAGDLPYVELDPSSTSCSTNSRSASRWRPVAARGRQARRARRRHLRRGRARARRGRARRRRADADRRRDDARALSRSRQVGVVVLAGLARACARRGLSRTLRG